jgi:uncharacterized protein
MKFEWDKENVGHIAEHQVLPEEVFADRHRFGVDAYNTPTERRWGVVGATEDGRVLFVVFTRRGSAIRVLQARDADPEFRRRYRRRK